MLISHHSSLRNILPLRLAYHLVISLGVSTVGLFYDLSACLIMSSTPAITIPHPLRDQLAARQSRDRLRARRDRQTSSQGPVSPPPPRCRSRRRDDRPPREAPRADPAASHSGCTDPPSLLMQLRLFVAISLARTGITQIMFPAWRNCYILKPCMLQRLHELSARLVTSGRSSEVRSSTPRARSTSACREQPTAWCQHLEHRERGNNITPP